MMIEHVVADRQTTPIRRLTDDGLRWRVMVETWRESEAFHGRLVFRREESEGDADRQSAALLHGSSMEDVLALAHDFPEDRLRRVLYSLG